MAHARISGRRPRVGVEEMMPNRKTIGALAVALIACSNTESRPPAYGGDTSSARNDTRQTPTTPRTERENTVGLANESSKREPTAGMDSLSKIVDARCSREAGCGNVGINHKYSTTSECETKVREEWREELASRSCEQGFDHQA